MIVYIGQAVCPLGLAALVNAHTAAGHVFSRPLGLLFLSILTLLFAYILKLYAII